MNICLDIGGKAFFVTLVSKTYFASCSINRFGGVCYRSRYKRGLCMSNDQNSSNDPQAANLDWVPEVLRDISASLRRENLPLTAELVDDAVLAAEIEVRKRAEKAGAFGCKLKIVKT